MKKTSIVALLAVTVLGNGAYAADLMRKSAPVAPVVYKPSTPIFAWTGFYGGLNAGYGWGGATGASRGLFADPSGVIGGGQIGYNHQVNQMVFGLETDLQYSDMRASRGAVRGSIPYFGTVRGRFGVAVDRFLPYLTGGLAYGDVRVRNGATTANPTYVGWTLGGGVEYAFTNQLSAKVEGLYLSLPSRSNAGTNVGFNNGIVRTGINYRF